MKVLIHHAEISLKKGNFSFFEKKLVENVRKACEANNINILNSKRSNKRILCEFDDKEKSEKIKETLKKVLGIKYFAFIEEVDKDFSTLEKHLKKIFNDFKKQGIKEIAFNTKRSDKGFPLKSPEINKKLGESASEIGLSFNYGSPEKTIHIEIENKIYVYTQRHEGFGGLPVGTGGKVLCLLSGGIDSPIAAWLMMKRGCNVDFLHFHAFAKNEEVFEKTVVTDLVKKLNEYQFNSKLYAVPYATYLLNTQGKIFEEYDLVTFKYYMNKFAEKLAKEKDYKAIITGDNLAQVASQTLENIHVTSQNISLPIFRPLLGYDKQEIINLSKKIEMFKLSLKNYKDCCSIISKNPSTKTKLKKFEKELGKINLAEIIEKSFKEMDEKKIGQ